MLRTIKDQISRTENRGTDDSTFTFQFDMFLISLVAALDMLETYIYHFLKVDLFILPHVGHCSAHFNVKSFEYASIYRKWREQ